METEEEEEAEERAGSSKGLVDNVRGDDDGEEGARGREEEVGGEVVEGGR